VFDKKVNFIRPILNYFSFIVSERICIHHHHHQPINVPTAGAQAFLMDYPQGERAITHHAGPVRIGGLNMHYCIIIAYRIFNQKKTLIKVVCNEKSSV
jgi:hypothetical protein